MENNNTINIIRVYFKEVYTDNLTDFVFEAATRINNVLHPATITQFKKTCLVHLQDYFKSMGRPNDNLEIVETDQYNYSVPEEAPALQDSEALFRDKWPNKQVLSFYVRYKA